MKNRTYIIYAIAAGMLLVWGCRGAKEPAGSDRYRRAPIREVTQEQLQLDSRLIDAKTQQQNGNLEAAIAGYQKILAQDPKMAAAHYELGRIFMQEGYSDSALMHAKEAVALNDGNVWYKQSLATIYELRHDGKGLTSTWEAIVKQNPDNLDYYYALSNAYLKANNVEAAIGALNRVEKRIGVSEPISLQKQRLWEAIGRNDKAQKEVEALSEALPQEKKYNAILAELNMKRQNYSKAKYYYDRIAEYDPEDEYINISIANYYKVTGQPEKAFESLKKGFLNPRLDGNSKLQLLGSFYTDEEFYGVYSKQAFELMDIAMKQCTDTVGYALFYGDVLMRQQKYKEAAQQFKLHLTQDSSQYEVWEALLICESEIDDNEAELLSYAKRAEALFPLHPLPHYLQGFMAVQHGHNEEALKHLEACQKIGFNKGYLEAEVYGLLATTYHRLGKVEEAYKAYDHYLQMRPNDYGMLNNYAYILAEDNVRLEEALEMSRRTIDSEPNNATFLDTYAWILHQLGRDKEALTYMERAVKNDKEGSETLKEHLEAVRNAAR